MSLFDNEPVSGAPAPNSGRVLTKAQFASLIKQSPDASDEEILERAVGTSSPSLLERVFEKPILPELEIENPVAKGAYGVVRNVLVGSPADLALNVATAGSMGLARGAAKGVSKLVAGGLSGAFGARGAAHALDEDLDPASRAFGVLQGALGAAGAASELRAFSPRLDRLVTDQAGEIKLPKGFGFEGGAPAPLKNPHAEALREALTVREAPAQPLSREVTSKAVAEVPAGAIPETPVGPSARHQGLLGRWYSQNRKAGKLDINLAREIRKIDAEEFSHLPNNAASIAIAKKLREESNGLIDVHPSSVIAIIRGESYAEPGMVARRTEARPGRKPGNGTILGVQLAGPAAAQFVDDEDDPSGAIQLGLNIMGLGALGAAAYWQLKPQSKLSTLASGQLATGKSFDDFKALAPHYVPEGYTPKQLERAWKFAEKKVDELYEVNPKAFTDEYWEGLYDANPSFSGWWDDALDVAKEVAPENPELFALFLSATSPRKPPKQNLQLAIRAWEEHKAGKPFSRVFGRSVIQNLNRAVDEGRIGGRKTSSMVETVLQKSDEGPRLPRAVLDRHMARLAGFGGHRVKEDDLTPPEYEILERILDRVAKKKGISVSKLQAGLWKTGMEQGETAHLSSLGREWQKPDIAYPFGQIKRVIDAEARLTKPQQLQFVKAAKHVVRQTTASPAKGSTVDPRTGQSLSGKGGFSISMFPERSLKVPAEHLTDSTVLGFIKDNIDLLEQKPFAVGSWMDDSGTVWLDVVALVKDRHHAEWLGNPLRYNQQGAADLSKTADNLPFPDEAFIPTGGTGQGFGPQASKFYDRLGDLETLDVEHYSRTPGISELDPSHYGKGMPGEESRRKGLSDWIDRSYAYATGTQPEARFRGAIKYTGRVPKRGIYDLAADPQGFMKQVDLQSPAGLNRLEKLISEAGFLGAEFPTRKGWLELFRKIGVELPAGAQVKA